MSDEVLAFAAMVERVEARARQAGVALAYSPRVRRLEIAVDRSAGGGEFHTRLVELEDGWEIQIAKLTREVTP